MGIYLAYDTSFLFQIHSKIMIRLGILSIGVFGNVMATLSMLVIINTHGRFAIALLPLTMCLSTELFEAVFIKKSSG